MAHDEQITLRIPRDLARELARRAKALRVPKSQLVREAMSRYLAEPAAPARDVLVYPDGDRVQGRLVEKTGDTIVFQSDRFGLLRVPAAGAEVIQVFRPFST